MKVGDGDGDDNDAGRDGNGGSIRYIQGLDIRQPVRVCVMCFVKNITVVEGLFFPSPSIASHSVSAKPMQTHSVRKGHLH